MCAQSASWSCHDGWWWVVLESSSRSCFPHETKFPWLWVELGCKCGSAQSEKWRLFYKTIKKSAIILIPKWIGKMPSRNVMYQEGLWKTKTNSTTWSPIIYGKIIAEWIHFAALNNELCNHCWLANTAEGRIWTSLVYLHYFTSISHWEQKSHKQVYAGSRVFSENCWDIKVKFKEERQTKGTSALGQETWLPFELRH